MEETDTVYTKPKACCKGLFHSKTLRRFYMKVCGSAVQVLSFGSH